MAERNLALPAVVAVIGLTLIGAGQLHNRHSIEDDLTERSNLALNNAGLAVVACFTGRDATLAGDSDDFVRAESVVAGVRGVRAVTVDGLPSPTAQPTDFPVGFTLASGTITVTGTVESAAAQQLLIGAVKAAGHSWAVLDKLTVDTSMSSSEPASDRLPAVTDLLATAPITGAKLVIQYNDGRVILRGAPATAAAERALLRAAAATVGGTPDVMDGLDVPAS